MLILVSTFIIYPMKRLIILSLLLSFNLFAQEKAIINIGAILPLSGNAQAFGQEARLALEHSLVDYKATKFNYNLIFEDDQMSSAKASLAAKRLVGLDDTKIVFSNWSYGGNAVASALKNKEALNLSFAWDISILDIDSNNFIISSPPEKLAELMILKIKEEKKDKIALIGFQEAGIEYAYDAIEDSAKKHNIKVVKRIATNPSEPVNFQSILLQLKSKKPDYIVACLIYPQMLELLKQMKQLKIDLPIAYMGQAPAGPALKSFLPKKWWSVDYTVNEQENIAIQKRTNLNDFSGYPAYYEALKAIISIYESSPTDTEPTIAWVKNQLNNYKTDKSLLGKIRVDDRRFVSENAMILDLLKKYK